MCDIYLQVYPMISYQGWNFLLCVLSHESLNITSGHDLFDVSMIVHHILAFAFSLNILNPFGHYFVIFYFGIIELTNIPLTVMDVFKYFKEWKEKYPVANQITRIVFALSFIFLRLIMWPIRSVEWWVGCAELLVSGKAHDALVVSFCLLSALAVTILQFIWGYKIFGFLVEKKGAKNDKSA